MARIIKTYITVVLLVSLGFFGVGAIVTASEVSVPGASSPETARQLDEASQAN